MDTPRNIAGECQTVPTRGVRIGRGWILATITTLLLLVAALPSATGAVATGVSDVIAGGPNTWSFTGSMITPRMYQTATLLPNGKVLVAGGCCIGGTGALSSTELYDPQTGTFTSTGSMIIPRVLHTATLLAGGREVLVTGGCAEISDPCNGPYPVSALAQLYDIATGTWHLTGSMVVSRVNHTATLLPNGKVLITGGEGCTATQCGVRSDAELYDPQTHTFTATGGMSTARMYHSATLLANGKVLIAGGCSDSQCSAPNASSELYDPATGTFTTTGTMAVARWRHTATLLSNGKVLVAGTETYNPTTFSYGVDSSAELYDPATGTWARTGSMATPRVGHMAVLMSTGQVLVMGGCTLLGVFANCRNSLSSVELYDPRTGQWVLTSSMGNARDLATATALRTGQVLVAGGDCCGTAELYTPGPSPLVTINPTSINMGYQLVGSNVAPQTIAVTDSGSLPLSVESVVISGTDASAFTMTTTCLAKPINPDARCSVTLHFVPQTIGSFTANIIITSNAPTSPQVVPVTGVGTGPNEWSQTGALAMARIEHTATLLPNGKVLIVGGCTYPYLGGCPTLATVAELYDPATGSFSTTGSPTTDRMNATATLLPNGKVLIAGGDCCGTPELYDPHTGTFTATGSMSVGRSEHTATLLPNGKVLIAGGDCCGTAELYDPATGTFTATGSMSTPRQDATATLLSNGEVLIAGGCCDASGTPLSSAELYDPSTGTFTETGSLTTPRRWYTATLLPTGKVLLAGGTSDSGLYYGSVASAELYDPATGTFTTTGSMRVARLLHTATLLPNGEVLVAGGQVGCSEFGCQSTADAELYDPATGVWTTTNPLIAVRQDQTATLLATGDVLVAGGTSCIVNYQYGGSCVGINASEIYRPALALVYPASGAVGQRAGVYGGNFFAHEPMQVYWDMTGTAPLATTITGGSGSFLAGIRVPLTTAGTHTLIVVGQHSGAVASASFQVKP